MKIISCYLLHLSNDGSNLIVKEINAIMTQQNYPCILTISFGAQISERDLRNIQVTLSRRQFDEFMVLESNPVQKFVIFLWSKNTECEVGILLQGGRSWRLLPV